METRLRCLIIEDEPIAVEILEDYIEQVPFLELVGHYPDALQASEPLMNDQIDVLFLDIHLPGIKGLDFLKSLPDPPKTIMTTAYLQYAVEDYDLNVVDYLMKPIPFPRFIQAILKLQGQANPKTGKPSPLREGKKKCNWTPWSTQNGKRERQNP